MSYINSQLEKPRDFTDYSLEFQQQLIADLITDKKFGIQIIDILEPVYFKNTYFNFIVKVIKEYHKEHEVIPNYIGIKIELENNYGDNAITLKSLIDTLESIRTCEMNNLNVTKIALKYCKFQRVRNTISEIYKTLEKGAYEDYDTIENLVRNAITFQESDEGVNFFADFESALDDDYRDPIATGIEGLDTITNGGLGKGELAVVIAPLGVGKTTFLSLLGSNAYLAGKNVLHIFMEDKIKEVRRKYLCHWAEVPLQELNANRDLVVRKAKEVAAARPDNFLIMEKLPSDSTTIAKLRRVIKRENNKLGGKLDMVIIDYADCIIGEQGKDAEEWTGEGKTMRQLESMAEEFDVALWTAVQGGRKSTTAAVVEVDMIGGNIKKAQVAHFIMSIAKTLPQRDQKLATIAILKSRFGDDGKIFENCPFDNSRMLIDTTTQQSADFFDQNIHQRQQQRVRDIAMAVRQEYAIAADAAAALAAATGNFDKENNNNDEINTNNNEEV